MSRHEQLADLAIQQAQRMHAVKSAAEDLAKELCNALVEHLGSPEEAVKYCHVTPVPYPGQRPQIGKEWWPVAGRGFPGLAGGQGDGFYYFAIRIEFERGCYYNFPRLLFGIRKKGELFELKMPDNDTRTIDPQSESDIGEFCETVFQGLSKQFSAPVEDTGKEIGFHAIDHPRLIEK